MIEARGLVKHYRSARAVDNLSAGAGSLEEAFFQLTGDVTDYSGSL